MLGTSAIGRTAAGPQPIRTILRRLSRALEAAFAPAPDELPFEPAFHALDDVACVRIRRR